MRTNGHSRVLPRGNLISPTPERERREGQKARATPPLSFFGRVGGVILPRSGPSGPPAMTKVRKSAAEHLADFNGKPLKDKRVAIVMRSDGKIALRNGSIRY